jgi:hypothetical protein
MQKIGYYVNLDKCDVPREMVALYGQRLEDMPIEARLTFRAALAAFQVSKHQWANAEQPPKDKRLIEQAIESVNSDAWESEQLTDWIIGFCIDPKENWRIEPMIRALSDSIACA